MPIFGYGNLVTLEHDPMVTATRVSSDAACAILRSTAEVANRLGVADPWNHASLGGTHFHVPHDTEQLQRRIHERAGLSLDIAPLAGLGFWHEWYTMGGEGLARRERQQAADERDLVVAVGDLSREVLALPVITVTDSLGEYVRETFKASFRRRIAYALGFHASLRAGSMACYDAWYEPAIRGAVTHLHGLASVRATPDRFSIVLNLLARLHGTMAYEHSHGMPDPRAPGRVLDYGAKVEWLETALAATVRIFRRQLNADGRIALRALLFQFRRDRREGWTHVLESPLWGHHVSAFPHFDSHPVGAQA